MTQRIDLIKFFLLIRWIREENNKENWMNTRDLDKKLHFTGKQESFTGEHT